MTGALLPASRYVTKTPAEAIGIGDHAQHSIHLAEALEVVIKQLKLLDSKGLPQDDMDALQVFLGDVAAVRGVKAKKALV